MSVYLKPGNKNWWFSIYRGPGIPRLRGSTGKTDRAEAEAVEGVMRLAFAGKSAPDRLHSMIDALSGSVRSGLPLAGVWGAYEGWATSTGRKFADITWRQRWRACERFAAWASECWPSVSCAGGVDRACAAGFASWLSAQGSSGKTRRNLIADLGTVWEGLRRVRDDVKVNPWPLVLPADDGKRGLAFTHEQEKSVMAAAVPVSSFPLTPSTIPTLRAGAAPARSLRFLPRRTWSATSGGSGWRSRCGPARSSAMHGYGIGAVDLARFDSQRPA